ncbi:hypothetical protein JR338_12185 [Chloroflexota bacterium]|nr:hypothetical protein JR338_12185 [Chloroflexota bacterium]
MTETNPQSKPNPGEPELPNYRYGGEIDIEEGGFIFRPIEGFELEIDRTVYMYSEDGNIEISLVGGELKEGTSIAEMNDFLASEFMESFDEFRVDDAGTDRIQEITGFLNDLHFKNAEEEGLGVALTCSPHINQYFFILVISSAEHWESQGKAAFDALKSEIRFYPRFRPEKGESQLNEFPDLTTETFQDFRVTDDFTLHVEKGDVSLLLAARSQDPFSQVRLKEVYAPGGQTLYQYDSQTGQLESNFCSKPIVGEHGELCFFYPRVNNQALQPGDYRFSFETAADTDLEEIHVVIRSGRALDAQAIDLNFWVAVADERFNDPVKTDAFFTAISEGLNHFITPLSLKCGKINVIQAAPDELATFSTIHVEKDLADCSYMIADSISNPRALNVGILQSIQQGVGDETTELEAISSGIPGMIMAPASPHACVLLSWSALSGDLKRLVQALIEQLVNFSGIDNPLEKGQALTLNREIAWRLRRHPLFYDAE